MRVTLIGAKNLSDKQTQIVRKRIHDLDEALWPDEQHGNAGLADSRSTSTEIQKSAAEGLREAQAKIVKLQAEEESFESCQKRWKRKDWRRLLPGKDPI